MEVYEEDFKQAIEKAKPLLKFVAPVIIVIWLLSGIYIVRPDEKGVVRRFGKMVRVAEPGPHYRLPFPFETVDKPRVKHVKRLEVGFRTIHPGPPARYQFIPAESIMLTGDAQIVDVQVIVQYQIKNASDFLFNVRGLRGRGGALMDATEVAMRYVVGKRPIDDVLIGEKLQVEMDMKEMLQQIMDSYQSGLRIIEVKLQTVRPPEAVAASFNDVVSAKEDRERLIKQAEGYREDIIPRARGKAESMLRAAEAYKQERVKHAEGAAEKFLSVLREYVKARTVTRKRLYLETMEEVLPGIKKFIIDKDVGGGVQKLLPLEKFTQPLRGEAGFTDFKTKESK